MTENNNDNEQPKNIPEEKNIEIDGDENTTEEILSTSILNPRDIKESRVLILPVVGRPFLPGQILPVQIASNVWKKTIETALKSNNKTVALFSVDDSEIDEAKEKINEKTILKHMPKTGCLIKLLHARINENDIQFIAEGLSRVTIDEFISDKKPPYTAQVSYPLELNESKASENEIKAHAIAIVACVKELIPLNPLFSEEIKQYTHRFNPNTPGMLADCAASITSSSSKELQDILETYDILQRLKKSFILIQKELNLAKLQDSIKSEVDEKMKKRQRDYYLNEQLKVIQKELGILIDDKTSDINKFKERMSKLKPSEEILKKFNSEIEKMKVLEIGSPEYTITRNYVDWLTNVPWGIYREENLDINHARKVLNQDHDAIEDVKERIIEFVAVGNKKKEVNGSILLFVGPPGVGKTSVGKSIARALNRPFYRFSVGGLSDESEIKGHRKTYIGAMPGKFVQAIKQTECMNPVIMLDEIDKIGHSYRGDPASALLETLDPEQNSEFLDHYLDVRVDLSKCLFICTANSLDTIPAPLLDRMDTISLTGYLTNEKLQIAKHHLLPKIIEKAGLPKKSIKIGDGVIKKIIEDYAREAGVRHLEKLLSKIVRKVVVKMLDENIDALTIQKEDLHDYLKSPLFRADDFIKGVGVATGLAWTSMGGSTIPIEAIKINDLAASLQITGSLGDVMKESVGIAYSYACSNIGKYEPKKKHFFDKAKIHIHVPEGATPKDGPSAGVTLTTALISLALNKPPLKGFAMTGELTLTGKVLAIGGIREKSLAAKRLGIKNLICPKANEGDVNDLPDFVKEGINYFFVEKYNDVFNILFPNIGQKK